MSGTLLVRCLSPFATCYTGFLRREAMRASFGMSRLAPFAGNFAPFVYIHRSKATFAFVRHGCISSFDSG
jgi:hypothetical protein